MDIGKLAVTTGIALSAISCGNGTNEGYNCHRNARTIVDSVRNNSTPGNAYVTHFPESLPAEFFKCLEEEVRIESRGRVSLRYMETVRGRHNYQIMINREVRKSPET